MKDEITIREFIDRFNAGEFDDYDVKTQIDAGWYDWFCKDKSLRNKTKLMGNIIKQIKSGGKVDLDKTYVFFKNNCPCGYSLYDDFRICDIETGNVLINVNINAYDHKRFAIFGRFPEGEFWDMPYVEFGTSKELVAWLNAPFGEIDQSIIAKRNVKSIVTDAQENARICGNIMLERLDANDDAIVAKLKVRIADKDSDALVEKLEHLEGYDVTKQDFSNEFDVHTYNFTFRRKAQ